MQSKNKTVVKSMTILNLFRIHSALTLNEIVQMSNLPKTSAHRMVGSLTEMGFLTKDFEGNYSLGLLFLEYGQLVSERLDLPKIAKPYMEALRDDVNEAVNLTIRDGNEALYVEKVDTDHPVRLFTKVGRRSPLYSGACSRILLAHIDEKEQESYIRTIDLKPVGLKTITDKEVLRNVLKQSRTDGVAISYSELENNTVSIAAPIFNISGQVIGGLSVAGPESRFPETRVAEMIEKVKQTANQISCKLGFN
ncbi:IclR family transcriptional regulator [Alkalihalobacillus sp. MEB130]|uniref:IclR family transcriptional regulator n=1 Tax=Alkalihalobacillus sp. MEB130 TaxID=2976704 RepID=UPI0028DE1381|nr:IclR family transcriptional regulator [Alkalihalobacillus sp. MEB130]MDT8862688.1 IclR family transcriptional regulator [Alkalihalobacillus sp. MEB130]